MVREITNKFKVAIFPDWLSFEVAIKFRIKIKQTVVLVFQFVQERHELILIKLRPRSSIPLAAENPVVGLLWAFLLRGLQSLNNELHARVPYPVIDFKSPIG